MKRYTFQSRPQELQETDVRVTTELSKENTRSLEEIISLDPDTSSAFKEIRKVIYPISASLPLLMYNLPEVVKVSLKHISACPHSVLQIFQALARDVRQELAPFFNGILGAFIVLAAKNELLEEIFTCISISLKYVIKGLDCVEVMNTAVALIGHKDAGIRHLASQSFSFLIRKDLELLKIPLEAIGENAWELVKFSVNDFSVNRVLKSSWVSLEAARYAHLSLANDKKYCDVIWESISEAEELTVLRDWAVLCNGNIFPKELLSDTIALCKRLQDPITLAYVVKYYEKHVKELEYILDQPSSYQCLKIISDFQDPHPESVIHEKLLHREYNNRTGKIDFTRFSEKIFSVINEHLAGETIEEALQLVMHCLENHLISAYPLKNLYKVLEESCSEEIVWIGLRVSRLVPGCGVPKLMVSNEYILRETTRICGGIQDACGESLWSLAEIHSEGLECGEKYLEYLLHPSLRVPATCLLQSSSNVLKIAWEICRDPASLENERQKITNLKRIPHFFDESPKAICMFLLGLFWERFSTLWKHGILCLAEFGKKYPDILWGEISKLLKKIPEPPLYPDTYIKYCHIRDWTPVDHVLKNIIEVLASSPHLVSEHISEYTEDFINFFNEEYLNDVWLSSFPLKTEYSWNKQVPKLKVFLKVFTVCKTLEHVPSQNYLRKIFTALLTEKNEEIRVLAADALINMKGEEFLSRDYIRALCKDATFRETILQKQSSALTSSIALCASRVFNKSPHTFAALQYISNSQTPEVLLEFLPVKLNPESACEVLELPGNLSVNLLRNLRNIIKHAVGIIWDKEAAVRFLIKLYTLSREKNREITNKAISCLTIMFGKYQCEESVLLELIELLAPVFSTFSFDIRPKFIELLHTMVQNYSFLHTNSSLLSALIALLTNLKLESKYIHKVLESLSAFEIPLTVPIISALTQAFSSVSLTPSLYSIFCKLPASPLLTDLSVKLLGLYIKKPEIKDLLVSWLEYCDPAPITQLSNLVLKFEEAIPLLAMCLPEPDGEVLKKLGATRRKGLNIEKNYDLQLEALHCIPDMLFMYPRAILYAVSHFMMSGDLGFRTTAGTAMLSLINTEGLEEALTNCIRKAQDEEQVRSILNVWNKLDTPLSNPDPERSTILNLGHLQVHRRARAMGNLEPATGKLIKNLIIPLLTFYLLYSTSRANYQPSFVHTLVTALGQQATKLSWRNYYKLVKMYIKALKYDEKVSTKALASILNSIPSFEPSAYQMLMGKVMPVLKIRLCDKRDQRRPKIRKFVAVAIFQIIQVQKGDEKNGELSRLLMILSRQYKHRDDGTRDSVLKAVLEMLKAGCPQEPVLREFNHGLEPELFALFSTKILPTGLITVTAQSLSVFHRILLEYEQYSSYYFIAKTISPELLPSLFASTKTLQYIVQGLSENTKVTPEDYISLALSLLNTSETVVPVKTTEKILQCAEDIKYDRGPGRQNDLTYAIQPGAAIGIRVKNETTSIPTSAEKVFGIRLLKLGVKKCVEIDTDVMVQCKNAAISCLSIKKDEAVIGALEVLRIVGDSSIIPQVINVAERAGELVTIHSMKTLSALIRGKTDAENAAKSILPQIIFALQSAEIQSSALKLLKIFIGYRILDENIYDAVEEIPRVIISNFNLASAACALYSQFLLTYPMSDKRKTFHVDFLVKNLGCVSKVANNGLLQALNVIIDKFPYEELKEYYDFLLLALVTAISNENTEEFIEKYLSLAGKVAKINSASSIFFKIFAWVSSGNPALQSSCTRLAELCLVQSIIPKNIIQSEVLPRVLKSTPTRFSLSFLVNWELVCGGVSISINESIFYMLENGLNLSEFLVSTLQDCTLDLMQLALKCIENGTFTQGITGVLGKAKGEIASRRVSAVTRKLFGRGIEDDRVVQLLKSIRQIIANDEYDRTAMLKTLIVFSRSLNTELKEVLQDIFKALHIGVSQEDFLKQYSQVKDKALQVKEGKKVKHKLLMVSDPELAAKLKQKKSKKSRLLKKQKLLKTAPYKRLKRENLIVK